ncbi:MAG: aminotransferase class I/II-fold pyridoxal phosphate-dependent enzyme [Bacteroidales bacterium]
MIHGHGSDPHNYNRSIVADFSSNVWFEGAPPELLKYLQKQLFLVDHYPDPEAGALQGKIARFHGLNTENCLVTNGSTEAFYLIAQAYRKSRSAILIPCFSEYEDACKTHEHSINFINHSEKWERHIHENELVWLGNPNNPDGKLPAFEQLEQILTDYPDTLFVVDEAYGELCASFQSVIPLIQKYPNLLVVHSFTKSFAIPGLRLGYLLGQQCLTERIRRYRMPWNVNTLAQKAGQYIVEHYDQVKPDKQKVKKASQQFQHQLTSLEPLLTVIPSDCNYCLVRLNGRFSGKLKDLLVEHYGLLIRDASNFRGLNEKYIRLAVQKPSHNKLLTENLNVCLKALYNGQ